MHPLIKSWDGMILEVAKRPYMVVSGVRKIVQAVSWDTPGELWTGDDPFSFEDLGYSGKDNKVNQLTRIYYNEGNVQAAREKLKERIASERTQTSVGIVMQGDDKDSRSQGHCIQNIVLSHAVLPKKSQIVTLDIFYRSTEGIKKFMADILFLKQVVFPGIMEGLPPPNKIRFFFSNIYLSALFMPIQLRYAENKLSIFETLEEHDPRFFRTALNACSKFFEDSHNYSYRERVKMFEYCHQHLSRHDIIELRSYCRSYRT